MEELPIKVLQGIGCALEEKLKGIHFKNREELRMISKVFMINIITYLNVTNALLLTANNFF